MTRSDARRTARAELQTVTDRLVAEFAGELPPGTVNRYVDRAREELLLAGVRDGLVPATESMARVRLFALIPAHA